MGNVASIYVITNKKNGKVYVGQTWGTIQNRFHKHKSSAKNYKNGAKILDNAIRKYGIDNFVIEKIDEATTQQQADVLEQFYILASKSVHVGYNIRPGGATGMCAASTRKLLSEINTGRKPLQSSVEKMRKTKKEERTHAGENHGCAKLTEQQVREIRNLVVKDKLDNKTVSKMYGITPKHIHDICCGDVWEYAGGPTIKRISYEQVMGEQCAHSKLTESIVRDIREKYAAGGVSMAQLAKEYGVHKDTVCAVMRRRTWRHI